MLTTDVNIPLQTWHKTQNKTGNLDVFSKALGKHCAKSTASYLYVTSLPTNWAIHLTDITAKGKKRKHISSCSGWATLGICWQAWWGHTVERVCCYSGQTLDDHLMWGLERGHSLKRKPTTHTIVMRRFAPQNTNPFQKDLTPRNTNHSEFGNFWYQR